MQTVLQTLKKAKQSKRARSVRNYVFHFTILVPTTVMSLSLSWEQPWLGLIPLDVSHCTGPFTPLPVANHPFSSIKSVPATLVFLKNAPCAHTLMYPKVMGDTTFSSALSPLQIPPLPLSFSFIAHLHGYLKHSKTNSGGSSQSPMELLSLYPTHSKWPLRITYPSTP